MVTASSDIWASSWCCSCRHTST